MKGRITLHTKAKSLIDSIHYYANCPRFRRCFEDYYRYCLNDVIDDNISYYNIIGVPFGLRRRYKKIKCAMHQYNNDICILRDLA